MQRPRRSIQWPRRSMQRPAHRPRRSFNAVAAAAARRRGREIEYNRNRLCNELALYDFPRSIGRIYYELLSVGRTRWPHCVGRNAADSVPTLIQYIIRYVLYNVQCTRTEPINCHFYMSLSTTNCLTRSIGRIS